MGFPSVSAAPGFDWTLATEQQRAQELKLVILDAMNILHWLDDVATAVDIYRKTPGYAEAKRKSGWRWTSGLTEEELALKNKVGMTHWNSCLL